VSVVIRIVALPELGFTPSPPSSGLGIDAVPGVIDGGGNTTSGNGNPEQCTNVSVDREEPG
jgi:hypothetical protein